MEALPMFRQHGTEVRRLGDQIHQCVTLIGRDTLLRRHLHVVVFDDLCHDHWQWFFLALGPLPLHGPLKGRPKLNDVRAAAISDPDLLGQGLVDLVLNVITRIGHGFHCHQCRQLFAEHLEMHTCCTAL
jgi:hypothetical protein